MTLPLTLLSRAISLKLTLGITLAATAIGAVGGWKARDIGYQRHLSQDVLRASEWRDRVAEVGREGYAIGQQERDALDTSLTQARSRYATLLGRIPHAISPSDDRTCNTNALVRLHNTAASEPATTLPSPTSEPDTAPPAPLLSDVGRVIVGNYGVSEEWRLEAEAWRGWYQQQAEAWNRLRE